jgi:hypothetical protein
VTLVEDVQGDVSIDTPRDFANSGTQVSNDTRLSYWYRPLSCRCTNIRGDLHARIGRMALEVQGINGKMDVQNDFGDTTVALNSALAAESHRFCSISGRLEINAERPALGKLPVVLATSYGTLRTNTQAGEFPDFDISTSSNGGGHWSGFQRAAGPVDEKGQGRPMSDVLGLVDVLQGKTHPPGMVVLSQVGTIVFNLRGQK